MNKVTVLMGGTSSERKVSLVSGAAIAQALRELGYEAAEVDPADWPDFRNLLQKLASEQTELVFIGLHGGSGENGELQAALDLAGYRFTGSRHQACALTMDKYAAKLLASAEGVPTAEHILLRGDVLHDYSDPTDYSGITDKLGLPLIVKPNDGGSSVGISLVDDISTLKAAVLTALQYSSSALLEAYIPGREITATVLDGQALPLVEIRPRSGWYDYQNKYNTGRSEYLAPAPVSDSTTQLIQSYAERLCQVFGLGGYARIDFRFDGDKPYFLEVNTLPGMTPLSLTPMAAKTVGLSFNQLVERIISLALK